MVSGVFAVPEDEAIGLEAESNNGGGSVVVRGGFGGKDWLDGSFGCARDMDASVTVV